MIDNNKIKSFAEAIGIIVIGVAIGTIIMLIIALLLKFFGLPGWLLYVILLSTPLYGLWRTC